MNLRKHLKKLPGWIIVAACVITGAGAAVGAVLAGNVTGDIPVTVSQSILVSTPIIELHSQTGADLHADGAPQTIYNYNGAQVMTSQPDRYIASVGDDRTSFEVAAELNTGDAFLFSIPAKNASDQDVVAEITLQMPEGISAGLFIPWESFYSSPSNPNGNILGLVRAGANKWIISINSDAEYDLRYDLINVVISTSDCIQPGFYNVSGTIKQICV